MTANELITALQERVKSFGNREVVFHPFGEHLKDDMYEIVLVDQAEPEAFTEEEKFPFEITTKKGGANTENFLSSVGKLA